MGSVKLLNVQMAVAKENVKWSTEVLSAHVLQTSEGNPVKYLCVLPLVSIAAPVWPAEAIPTVSVVLHTQAVVVKLKLKAMKGFVHL